MIKTIFDALESHLIDASNAVNDIGSGTSDGLENAKRSVDVLIDQALEIVQWEIEKAKHEIEHGDDPSYSRWHP